MGEGLKRAAAVAAETKTPKAGKFGKRPAREDPRTLRLARYLAPDLAPAPPAFNVLPRVEAGAKVKDPTKLFPIFGNDRFGDCTIAAAAHAETCWNGACGVRRVTTRQKVVDTYFHLSGGQDTGLVELDVLNYWRSTGITGERILAFASVNLKNHDRVKQAISIFGGVYIGFQVQQGAVERFDRRQMWVPDTLTSDGHAVYVYAYDANSVACLTWGSTQRGTWSWWSECVDECWVILPGEATIAQFAPGLDIAALKADLAAVSA